MCWRRLSSSAPSHTSSHRRRKAFSQRESHLREVPLVAKSLAFAITWHARASWICSRFLCVSVHQEVKFLCRPLPPRLIGAHAHTAWEIELSCMRLFCCRLSSTQQWKKVATTLWFRPRTHTRALGDINATLGRIKGKYHAFFVSLQAN